MLMSSLTAGVGVLRTDSTVAHAKTTTKVTTKSTTTTTTNTTVTQTPYNSSVSNLEQLTFSGIKLNYDNYLEYAIVYQLGTRASTLSFKKISGVTKKIAFEAMNKVITQNPILVDVGAYTWHPATSTKAAYLSLTYKSSKEDALERQRAIVEGLEDFEDENFTSGMSTQYKMYVIYKWMDKNITYNNTAANIFTTYGGDSAEFYYYQQFFSPFGVLSRKTGICQSYAGTVKLLLDKAGVKNIIVAGKFGGVEHVWNKVDIDGHGHYYNYDMTYTLKNAGVQYMNYLSTDAQIKALGYTTDNNYIYAKDIESWKSPTTKLDPYTKNKYTVKDKTALQKALTKRLKGTKNKTFYYYLTNASTANTIKTYAKKALTASKRKDIKTVSITRYKNMYYIVYYK